MSNFYSDNDDIKFLFKHYDLAKLARRMEDDFKYAEEFAHAPANAQEAIENYDMVLESVGQLSAEFIAPRSESIDRQGNTHNEDGSVSYADGIAESLDALAKAQVMGFTLPHRFGGLNFPETVYTMSIEMVSRADASLMNLFGLQGIAGTLNAFASEEIKQDYLPELALGHHTGAMVLTEPDAGSDLQAIQLRAYQDSQGQWYLHGVKRFITNGCGEVLLVLARSEPDRAGGLGLSSFVCHDGPTVHIRRIEDKLGIHGSPTCELFFDNTPCTLVGERQRGLVTHFMALMNGARIGISAQSVGIAEATYAVARDYAASREQYGVAIEKLSAVRDMVIEMKIAIEASRALLYETSEIVDFERYFGRKSQDKTLDNKKEIKKQARTYKRYASMLTPMSKYFCSEMSNTVTYDAIQVLGGSGFMRDYPCERHARDARITTIYEGTSQLQVIAAVRGVCGGTAEKYLAHLASRDYSPELSDLLDILAERTKELLDTVVFVKAQGNDYMDLYARNLVDVAIWLIQSYLFCDQASSSVDMQVAVSDDGNKPSDETIAMTARKAIIARRFITKNSPKMTALLDVVKSADNGTFGDYEKIIGPSIVD